MSAPRRSLLQDSSSSDEERLDLMEDEGDQHLPPVKKQVVSNKNSKAKHVSSKPKPATQILPSKTSSSQRRAADSPDPPRQRKQKREKKNEQVLSEGEEQTEDLSKPCFSKNKVGSKEKHVALHQATNALPSAVVSPKRPSKKKEAIVEDDKNNKEETTAVQKKQLIERVWSEGDQITILKGLIDYGGSNAASVDMNKFYEVIKDSLQLDATKTELIREVRKMKKKYQANLLKGKNGVNSEVFLWGTGGGDGGAGPYQVGADSLDNEISISISRLNPGAAKLEIEKKWKELKRKGIEINLEKIELLREATTLEAEELNS